MRMSLDARAHPSGYVFGGQVQHVRPIRAMITESNRVLVPVFSGPRESESNGAARYLYLLSWGGPLSIIFQIADTAAFIITPSWPHLKRRVFFGVVPVRLRLGVAAF